jgi:site-specific DNA-cytosine methylase
MCFVLENVASVLQGRHKIWMDGIIEELRSIKEHGSVESAYEVFLHVCSSEDAGLPQRRKRLYIVGARKQFYGVARGNPDFQWPLPLSPRVIESCLNRKEDGTLVIGDGATSDPSLLGGTAVRNLLNMQTRLHELGRDPSNYHIIVDIAASPSRENFSIGICPTITKHRAGCQGFYNTHLNRRLTLAEMIRLQGASPDRFRKVTKKISSKAMGQICGNAMSLPLVQRILQSLLPSVGLTVGL